MMISRVLRGYAPRGTFCVGEGVVVVVCLFWCGLLGCFDVRLDALELVFRLVYVC